MNESATGSSDYVRFIILFAARTGSTMLASSLNSNPRITCFGEVFNWNAKSQASLRGSQERSRAQEHAVLGRDSRTYLRRRVYTDHPAEVDAVGFKIAYRHFLGFPGLRQALADDTDIRVLHLARRNSLRQLVSLRIAQTTGAWFRPGNTRSVGGKLAWALRHPVEAGTRLRRRWRGERRSPASPRPGVALSPEELSTFIIQMGIQSARFDGVFREHRKLTLFYEDLVDRRDEVFAEAQSFLGVEPGPLTVTLRRQNPEPLRELISNYDQLYEAFKDTPQAAFFD